MPAACCSGQLKAQDASNPPSAVRRSPVSASHPLSSNKSVLTSASTWRAMGASSSTAFSKWASLSFRLLEPPCVPSRRSAKWQIRVAIYAGVALFGTFYLPLRNRSVLHTLNVGRHSGTRARYLSTSNAFAHRERALQSNARDLIFSH